MVARSRGFLSMWNRLPMAVYSGPRTSSPYFWAAAMHTRTGPQAVANIWR